MVLVKIKSISRLKRSVYPYSQRSLHWRCGKHSDCGNGLWIVLAHHYRAYSKFIPFGVETRLILDLCVLWLLLTWFLCHQISSSHCIKFVIETCPCYQVCKHSAYWNDDSQSTFNIFYEIFGVQCCYNPICKYDDICTNWLTYVCRCFVIRHGSVTELSRRCSVIHWLTLTCHQWLVRFEPDAHSHLPSPAPIPDHRSPANAKKRSCT